MADMAFASGAAGIPTTVAAGSTPQTFIGGWAGVEFTLASGTGSATLQYSYGGTVWSTVLDLQGEDVTFAASGAKQFALAGPVSLRWNVTSASSLVATAALQLGKAVVRPPL